MEKVLDLVLERQQLEGVEGERDVGEEDGLHVGCANSEVLTKGYHLAYVTTYLENNFVRLRNKSSAFKFTTRHNLRLNDAFLLPDHCLCHVLFFQQRQLRMVFLIFFFVVETLRLVHFGFNFSIYL